MIERSAIVRFACLHCRTIFDVDLQAISIIRGRAFSLHGVEARCKISSCRGHGHFVFAVDSLQPFLMLVDNPDTFTPGWLMRLRPCDIDAPEEPNPPTPAEAQLHRRRRA